MVLGIAHRFDILCTGYCHTYYVVGTVQNWSSAVTTDDMCISQDPTYCRNGSEGRDESRINYRCVTKAVIRMTSYQKVIHNF